MLQEPCRLIKLVSHPLRSFLYTVASRGLDKGSSFGLTRTRSISEFLSDLLAQMMANFLCMINAMPGVTSLSGSCMRCGSMPRPKGLFVLTMARRSLLSISTTGNPRATWSVTTSGCRWGYTPGGAHVPAWSCRRPFSSEASASSAQPLPSDSSHASVSAWLRGLSPSERAMVHQRLRGAQAALSLQHAFTTGDIKCSLQSTPELEVSEWATPIQSP